LLNETRLRDSVAETSGLVVGLDCFSLNESYIILSSLVVVVVVYLKSGREASIYTLTPGILEASTRFY
jgi:hypothetical protein